MTKTLIATAALLAASATPAFAGSTQDNLRLCKAELVTGEYLPATATGIEFDRAKRGTVKLEVETSDGASLPVTCRVKRGEVVAIEMDGRDLVLRTDAGDTTGQ